MKFLIFNAVVAAALIYLFNGNGWGNDWSLQRLASHSLPSAAQPAPATAKAPKPEPPKLAAAPAPKPKPKPEPPKPAAAPAPKPAPVKQADPTPPAPAVAKRRAVVLSRQAAESPNGTRAQTRFMSRQERRQSLLSMAEDMELFSVEAAAR